MPAKPLTLEQLQDAARLTTIFNDRKSRYGLTQATLADDLGYSVQSSVSQYLKGKIPLNVAAAIKFAHSLRCRVADFSPSLQEEIDRIAEFASSSQSASKATQQPKVATTTNNSVWQAYSKASHAVRAAIDLLLLPDHERIQLGPEAQATIVLMESVAIKALDAREMAKKVA